MKGKRQLLRKKSGQGSVSYQRKPKKRAGPGKTKAFRKKQRLLYSGALAKDLRDQSLVKRSDSQEGAYKELCDAGYITAPVVCPSCCVGQLNLSQKEGGLVLIHPRSGHFSETVENFVARQKGRRKAAPRKLTVYYRLAGILERGPHGRLLMMPLPAVAV